MSIRIALSSDDNYVVPLAACVRSILDNAHPTGDVEIAVLSCGITADSRRKLVASWGPAAARVTWIDIDLSRLAGLPTKSRATGHLNATTYARLLLPDVLPETWDRVLFLDTDLLVLGSLAELWTTPLGEFPFAAARDPYTPLISSEHGVPGWQALRLDPNAPYFNAGVLLIDLPRWRRDRISKRAFDYIRDHRDEILLADQEAMNAVANGGFRVLDPVWNVMNYWYWPEDDVFVQEHVVDHARIRHYNGDNKPWVSWKYHKLERLRQRSLRGEERPWSQLRHEHCDYDVFFDYLDRTAWRGWRPAPEPAGDGVPVA
ncbi:glycosyltransferase family 8 protein [Saccharothrix sp. S26]|uniref:glycosyltransferase family 8 protein n=1 Tax=Saccharothrix sp. S26 TaxID=2907215 RepID=UPI001F3CEE9C|nr:glycosyltransferase family 8 protein [Saccharothrix sp. S26]MCE6995228.1 glycosyltransferase family 8 protein [Saccharothrix sp. S26]